MNREHVEAIALYVGAVVISIAVAALFKANPINPISSAALWLACVAFTRSR